MFFLLSCSWLYLNSSLKYKLPLSRGWSHSTAHKLYLGHTSPYSWQSLASPSMRHPMRTEGTWGRPLNMVVWLPQLTLWDEIQPVNITLHKSLGSSFACLQLWIKLDLGLNITKSPTDTHSGWGLLSQDRALQTSHHKTGCQKVLPKSVSKWDFRVLNSSRPSTKNIYIQLHKGHNPNIP